MDSQRRLTLQNGVDFSKPVSGGPSSTIAAAPSGHALNGKTVT
jgi:hypothetical protein